MPWEWLANESVSLSTHGILDLIFLLKAHTQANDLFLFWLCYIFLSVWISEGNISTDYNFQKNLLAT